MIDREKVISGLERCTLVDDYSCTGCPYSNCAVSPDFPFGGECVNATQKDALAMLQADQAQLVEQRKRLETIAVIAVDYDGYTTNEDLRALIDEMRDIALRGVPEEVTDDDK